MEIQLPDGAPPFFYIDQNDLLERKKKELKEEEIYICVCKINVNDPDSACGARCENVVTCHECVPGYCPCGDYCKNKKFQNLEYAKTKLFKTEGRGWGLLADEKIKEGQFIIEYCGEVISTDEAEKRFEAYESQGLKDAYMISIDSSTLIDATAKGNLARFINHSCLPNCETKKWTVLGESRIGIFAKEDIDVGTELTYNYKFEWYGGVKVRCLCGAPNCSKFLGGKSLGFQEQHHGWEDNDERYDVENFPTYDSAEDEPSFKLPVNESSSKIKTETPAETLLKVPAGVTVSRAKAEVDEEKTFSLGTQTTSAAKKTAASGVRSNSYGQNYQGGPGSVPMKKSVTNSRKKKNNGGKPVDGKHAGQLFKSKAAQEEILRCEERRAEAATKLNAVYDEIRPTIEEHAKDSQENVDVDVALKWIGPYCANLKADFGLSSSIVKNFMCQPPQSASTSVDASGEAKPSQVAENENIVKKLLTI